MGASRAGWGLRGRPAVARGSPGRRGLSRQELGPSHAGGSPPHPAPGAPSPRPAPRAPPPQPGPFPFFLSRPARPLPGGARSAARPMASVPGRASADPPRLPAAGSQSGRRGRPRPRIKSAGRQATLQSRGWEKRGAPEQNPRPPLLSAPRSRGLPSLPPARPAGKRPAGPGGLRGDARRTGAARPQRPAPSHLPVPGLRLSLRGCKARAPGGSELAMVGRAGRQAWRRAGTCFALPLAAGGCERRPWRSLGGVACGVPRVAGGPFGRALSASAVAGGPWRSSRSS